MRNISPQNPINNMKDEDLVVEQGYILNDWFIFREERHFGPLTTKQIRYCLDKNLISGNHFIWRPGFTGWTAIKDVEGFRSYSKQKIKYLSDNEFSNKALLGGVDRIFSEQTEINFINKAKTDVYERESFRKEREEKGLPPYLLFSEKMDKALKSIGITHKHAKPILSSVLSLVFCVGVYSVLKSDMPKVFEGLPEGFQNKLVEISSLPESIENPGFKLFPKDVNAKDPVLVGGTNLPVGSRVMITITGKPKTLLNSYRFNKKIELNVQDKLFQTDSIREESGKFIPPGVYTVVATCLGCSKERTKLYSQDYTFGVTDTADYKEKLEKFHDEARRSAKLELQELSDLSNNLSQQFKKSSDKYRTAIRTKSFKPWDDFSAGWLLNQRKLIDLFEQMESADFQSKLFYLSMYKAYNKIIKEIFELHILQNSVIEGDVSESGVVVEEGQVSEQIKIRLTYLKSQLDLMNVNFGKTTGLPETTGLNI